MAIGKARMPRDDGNQPIPIMAVERTRKISFTSSASSATALPTLADGSNPRIVTLYADTAAALVAFGDSGVTVADFSSNLSAAVLVPASTSVDVPVRPNDDGSEKTHFAVVSASFPSTQASGTLAIMARS